MNSLNNCGIYKIINLVTADFYIGSSIDLKARKRNHYSLLKLNKHHCIYLQRAYNKYGFENFEFQIIELCEKEVILIKEQFYLNSLKPKYNISKSSFAPMTGRTHTEETKKLFKNKIPWNKGIPRTDDEKRKMSESRLNTKMHPNTRLKLIEYFKKNGAPFKGKTHTEENKKLFREINIKKNPHKILCVNTKEIFEAQIDAAKKYNIKQGHISENLHGKRSSVKGFKFMYLIEENNE